MFKLMFRFFILCVFFTALTTVVVFYLYRKIENDTTAHFVNINTTGKYYSIYEYLKKYPENQWQSILTKLKPENASIVNALPIESLPLSKQEIEKIKNHQFVYDSSQIDKYHPIVVYKRIDNSNYAFQEFMDFSINERIHRFIGWIPMLIKMDLTKMPEKDWPTYLKNLSHHYGIPITVIDKNTSELTESEKQMLLKDIWVVKFPKNSHGDEIVYTSLFRDKF